MGGRTQVFTSPAPLVRAPATYGLYQRILVPGAGSELVALLTGGALPQIPVPNVSGPTGRYYQFGYVDLASEESPLAVIVRYTDDGQTAATATLGFVVPQEPSWVRIPAHPDDIFLISAGADVQVQVRLSIMGQEGP